MKHTHAVTQKHVADMLNMTANNFHKCVFDEGFSKAGAKAVSEQTGIDPVILLYGTAAERISALTEYFGPFKIKDGIL